MMINDTESEMRDASNISHDYVGNFVFSLLISSPFYSGLFVD
jgi:hypothetical protein